MADLLALEWDHDQVCGVQAQVSGARVRVRRCFVLNRPAVPVAGSGPMPVDWLKTELAARGITSGPVLVSLPRDEAIVKRIELPETNDDELPVLVRFQAGAKSSVPLDELSLDFIPLPRRSEVPGREALIATVPRQTIAEIRTSCESAGLDLQTLGLTPAAVAELVARAEPKESADPAGASLVVSRHGSRLEISVFRRCHLLFAHSARLSIDESGPEPQAIVSEVSRALVALRGAIPDVRIERVWTLLDAPSHQQLSEVLQRRLSCTVQPLDPFAGIEREANPGEAELDPAQFSGPIGLLLASADPRVPRLDFLAPRQPPVKRDAKKRRMTMLAAGGGVLVALLLGNYWITLSGLDSELAELAATRDDLVKQLKRGEPTLKSADLVDQWEQTGLSPLDELAALQERMPPRDRVYLKKVELYSRISANSPARIKEEGFARERKEDVLGLSDKLLAGESPYAGVLIPSHSSPSDDQHYPWQFVAEVQFANPTDKKPGAKKAAVKTGAVKEDAEKKPAAAKPGTPAAESPPAAAPDKAASQPPATPPNAPAKKEGSSAT